MNEFLKILFEEKGNAFYVPKGFFGRSNMFMTQNPDDYEKVFRSDGVWPIRKGFEILDNHRQVHRKDYFGETNGLLTRLVESLLEFIDKNDKKLLCEGELTY